MKTILKHPTSIEIPRALQILCKEAQESKDIGLIGDELIALYTHWKHQGSDQIRLPNWRASKKWLTQLESSGFLKEKSDLNVLKEDRLSFPDFLNGNIPFPQQRNTTFSFIDLFAGIGGFRMALQNLSGKCVFSSEWDKHAQNTYFRNYGALPFGDIRRFTADKISDFTIRKCVPSHDILCAGFPCQPFSHAGVSARRSLGQSHGFDCSTQGTLFFDLIRIAKAIKPKVLFLENVRNLVSHDKGNTFQTIKKTIEEELGYSFNYSIVNARSVVPQKRVRCFMVCFRDENQTFEFPDFEGEPLALKTILESPEIVEKFTISDKMWAGHQRRTATNKARGAGFTTYVADLNSPANTIVARYWKDGKECLVPQEEGANPRTLTPRECARLQGYPESFILPESKKYAYMQLGNSVVVPVVQRIGKKILETLQIKHNEI